MQFVLWLVTIAGAMAIIFGVIGVGTIFYDDAWYSPPMPFGEKVLAATAAIAIACVGVAMVWLAN